MDYLKVKLQQLSRLFLIKLFKKGEMLLKIGGMEVAVADAL